MKATLSRRWVVAAAAAACWLAVGALGAGGLRAQRGAVTSSASGDGLEVLQLRENFYLIAGAGGHVGIQVGDDGVVVVDAGAASKADAVLAAIRDVTDRPIRYVINTSADADHVGGNATIAAAGQTLFTQLLTEREGGASIMATEQVLARVSAPTGQASPFPATGWPTETFYQPRKYLYLNDEGIEVLRQPAAHTDGDAIVFFRRSDVVMAGDVLDTTRFPVIDVARGGSVQGEIAALNRLVELAIPSVPIVSRDAGTLVIPGHGRVYDQLDVVEYRDMVTIIRDRIRDLMADGLTLEQVKATAPTRGYTRRYGAETGSWTTDDFVDAVYRSLAQARERS